MDDPGSASVGFQFLHNAWSTLLTGFGALIVWNGRRLIGQVDGKADKYDLDELKEMFNQMQQNQVDQHQQNSRRLDTILLELYKGNRSDR